MPRRTYVWHVWFDAGKFHVQTRKHDRILECRYNPTYPGMYTVEIYWGGDQVPGSPFQVPCHSTHSTYYLGTFWVHFKEVCMFRHLFQTSNVHLVEYTLPVSNNSMYPWTNATSVGPGRDKNASRCFCTYTAGVFVPLQVYLCETESELKDYITVQALTRHDDIADVAL